MNTLALLLMISSLSSEVWTERDEAEAKLTTRSFTVAQYYAVIGKLPPRIQNAWTDRLLDTLMPPGVAVWYDKDYLMVRVFHPESDVPRPLGKPWLRSRDQAIPYGSDDYSPYIRCRREAKYCATRYLVESKQPEEVRLWLEDCGKRIKNGESFPSSRIQTKVRRLFGVPLIYRDQVNITSSSYAYAPDVLVRRVSDRVRVLNRPPVTGDWVVPQGR